MLCVFYIGELSISLSAILQAFGIVDDTDFRHFYTYINISVHNLLRNIDSHQIIEQSIEQ